MVHATAVKRVYGRKLDDESDELRADNSML